MVTKAPGLGEYLISKGLIDQVQLEDALQEQTKTRERLGGILLRRDLITDLDLLGALGNQLGVRLFDPNRDEVQTPALNLVPLDYARLHDLLPISIDQALFTVAMADPLDVVATDQLQRIALREQMELQILLAASEVLDKARETHYGWIEGDRHVSQLIDEVVDEVSDDHAFDILDDIDGEAGSQDAGIIKLVDQVINNALKERATDIHIEPQAKGLVIRYRVDGLLYDALTPPRAVFSGMVSRIKILSNMDIAERRATQDGRMTHRNSGREVDIRVSAIPTIHGEKIVMRLLDKTGFNFSLKALGLAEDDINDFLRCIRKPYGMILLSGPTGSGKTTTLYSSLMELRGEELNITTIEDPVEYQIDRMNQVQVNNRKNVTFANALRSFLRQDPDVIMVGEIRDTETAEIAIRAALTGHMVFSTIHANDAPSTAARLVSMGAEPFMAASAMTLVAAQRLVRRNCPHCLEEYEPTKEVLMALGLDADRSGGAPPVYRRGAGCVACKGRGYQGRLAVIEKLIMSQGLRQLIANAQPAGVIRELAIEEGMKTLQTVGLDKARAGQTSIEEVLRVCVSED
ncbi:GspE/PulE family protein [bacterium]|nr:GspE/PulE family protein [bacterium]MBU1073856.1 GspE/PulE family protein [bacterium]MBU1675752.1 GspE/PulE family protein [bacterium]